MGRLFPKLQPPIYLSDSLATVRKFVKEMSVLSGTICASALETQSIENGSIVK